MTKEMLWLLMGHLVCIGQWAAFIMVNYAFLGRGRRFRFPCLWAALLAAALFLTGCGGNATSQNGESTGGSSEPSSSSSSTGGGILDWWSSLLG